MRVTSIAFVLVCGLLLSVVDSAHAAPLACDAALSDGFGQTIDAPCADEEQAPERPWYGWQPLLSDALGVGLLIAGFGSGGPSALVWVGSGVLLSGAPAIHAAHQNWLAFGLSLGLRVAGGLGILGGIATALSDGSSALAAGLFFVGLLSTLTGFVIGIALAYDEVPPRPKAYALTPWADPRGSAGLQLTAAF